jgi:hypothetical protein
LLSGENLYLNKKPDFGTRVQLALPFLSACEPVGAGALEDIRALERSLVERGVVPAVAARICAHDSADQRSRILAAIRYLDAEVAQGKRFANPGGFLVSLVGKGAPAQAGDRGAAPAGAREPVASRPKAEDTYEIEYAYQTYLNEVGIQQFNKLDARELERLDDAKRRELLSSSKGKTFRNMPTEAFDDHVKYMIRKDLATKHGIAFNTWLAEWRQAG